MTHAAPSVPGLLNPLPARLQRVGPLALAVHGHVQLLAQGHQLLDRGRTAEVSRNQQYPVAPALEMEGQLGGGCRLSGSLQPGQHQDRWWGVGARQPGGLASEDGDELFVDYLHYLLAGAEGFQRLAAHGPLADPLNEVTSYPEVDVGFQQGQAYLAEAVVHVLLRESPLAGEAGEDSVELFRQRFKHSVPLSPL